MNQLYALRSEIEDLVETYAAGLVDPAVATALAAGWIAAPALTYSSADAPSYVVTCSGDYSGILVPGVRMKMTQSGSVKYFIVTKVSYAGGTTTITLYGGTDYTLGATITYPYFSASKAPPGFPCDPDKWTVTVTDTTDRSQASPTNNAWYNIGSMQISLPIGAWKIYYNVFGTTDLASAPAYVNFGVCLSTTNNGNTIAALYRFMFTTLQNYQFNGVCSGEPYTVAAKTALYLNALTNSNVACTAMHFHNDWGAMVIKAVCAYL